MQQPGELPVLYPPPTELTIVPGSYLPHRCEAGVGVTWKDPPANWVFSRHIIEVRPAAGGEWRIRGARGELGVLVPGSYCYRGYVATDEGRSEYSKALCVDIPEPPFCPYQGSNTVCSFTPSRVWEELE